jgi:tripeptide aminopeptidase
MGLPCPNLCTGGENFHSRFEFLSVTSLSRITRMLVELLCELPE